MPATSSGGERTKWAQAYEAKIRKFLIKLGFADVNGGPEFHIGDSSQIDACGGIGDVLFVVDCYHPYDDRSRSIRQKIKAQRGEASVVREGLESDPTYSSYTEVLPVVAVKGIEVRQADQRFASAEPGVLIWDDQFVDYYSRLAAAIGEWARYDLLGETGLGPTSVGESPVQVPAVKTTLGGKQAYAFFLKARELLPIAYVARREKGMQEHYQRLLKPNRIHEEIGPYLRDKGDAAFFANNIILSFETKPTFKPFEDPNGGHNVGMLTLPSRYRSAWIVDGQHRLFGFTIEGTPQSTLLPVVGLVDMSPDEQAELFLTINREQRPVSPNLIWVLAADIYPESEMGLVARSVLELSNKKLLRGLLEVPGRSSAGSARPLKFGNVCESIHSRGLLETQTANMKARALNPLWNEDPVKRVTRAAKAISLFWEVLSDELPEERKNPRSRFWFTNNGFNVAMRIFEQLLVMLGHLPTKKEIKDVLSPLFDYYRETYRRNPDFRTLRSESLGEAGRKNTATRFMVQVHRHNRQFAPEVAAEADVGSAMKLFERRLAEVVWREALAVSENPKGEASQVVAQSALRKGIADTARYHEVMTIGDTIPLVERHWAAVFAKLFGRRFPSSTHFNVYVSGLAEIRADEMHGRPIDDRKRSFWTLHSKDVEECLDHWAQKGKLVKSVEGAKMLGTMIPQADDLERVIHIAVLVSQGKVAVEELSDSMGIAERQGRYYASAAEILGLISWEGSGYELTNEGRRYIDSRDGELLKTLVLQTIAISAVLKWVGDTGRKRISNQELAQFIEQESDLSGATSLRRAQTLCSWLVYIGKATRTSDGIDLDNRQTKL